MGVEDKEGNCSLFSIVNLRLLIDATAKDVTIIHEILHVVEASLKETSKPGIYFYKTGMECMTVGDNGIEDESDNSKKTYLESLGPREILSENWHDYIAMLVTEDMHNRGIYLYDNPETSETKDTSAYCFVNPITEPLIGSFSKEIIDGMINPNIEEFYDIVGEENIDRLSTNVTQFYKECYKGIEEENEEWGNELIEACKKIISDMENNRQRHNRKTKSLEKQDSIDDLWDKEINDTIALADLEEINNAIRETNNLERALYPKEVGRN